MLCCTNWTPAAAENQPFWALPQNWVVRTPPHVSICGPDHNKGIVFVGMQGTYNFELFVTHTYCDPTQSPDTEKYSETLTAIISKNLDCTGQMNPTCTGWSSPPALPEGSFEPVSGAYCYKPIPTIPVCTGDFQVTLTWDNGSYEDDTNGETDLDLHLYGPDGLYCDYTNKIPGVGGITLDRDVIDDAGPVQENICAPSLSEMPRGEYGIEVDHYSGVAKSFQVRVLIGTKSTTYSGFLNPQDGNFVIPSFTL